MLDQCTRTDFFHRRQKLVVKIDSCALTFVLIKNRTFPSDNLSSIKNRFVCADLIQSDKKYQSDVIQQ